MAEPIHLLKLPKKHKLDEDHLEDVLIASPLNNEVLTYELATALWKNKVAGGGGAVNVPLCLFEFSKTVAFGTLATVYTSLSGLVQEAIESLAMCNLNAGVFKRLRVKVTKLTVGTYLDVTLRKNGADSILLLNLSAVGEFEDVNDVLVAEGDDFDIKFVVDSTEKLSGNYDFKATVLLVFQPS